MVFGAIAALLLVKGCNCTKAPTTPVIVPTKEIKQEVKKVEWNYKKSADSLSMIVNRLRTDSARSRSVLIAVTGKTRQLEQLLISNKPAPCDTNAINEQYQRTIDYMAIVNAGDSACNEVVETMSKQINIEMQATELAESRATASGVLLQQALANADAQELKAGKLKKQLTWVKLGNKVWKSAAIIAIGYIILSTLK